ncbi:hypothetical protein GKO28_15380 [Deefgea sp. CFH1-16]|nr:hypothetical protein [Deefgea sp. CFH1-16]
MRKSDALQLFGSQTRLAEALGLGRSAVSQWPDQLNQKQSDQVMGAALRLGLIAPPVQQGSSMQKIRKAVFPCRRHGYAFLASY